VKSARTAASNNVWHVAADWCEAFGPVVFGKVEERLRTAALAERGRLKALLAAGEPLDQPQVLLLDDIPVYGRSHARGGASRRDEGFFLLVAGEVVWGPAPAGPDDSAGPVAEAEGCAGDAQEQRALLAVAVRRVGVCPGLRRR
jgi:hypothetical protein